MSKTHEMWKKRVASWRASGKTAEVYSQGRGWSAGTLRWWSSRLRREAPPPVVRMAQLVRSPIGPGMEEHGGAIVVEVLDARVRITIERDADREMAATVVALLAGRRDR